MLTCPVIKSLSNNHEIMRSTFTASRFEFFMLLEYRSLNPDLEMIQTYSGEVFHLNEACIYVPREMMKSWLDFSRTIRKLELTSKELAVTLAVALTFRGIIIKRVSLLFIRTQITHSLHIFCCFCPNRSLTNHTHLRKLLGRYDIQCIALNQIKLVHTLEYLGYSAIIQNWQQNSILILKKGMKSIAFLLTFTKQGAFNFIFLQSQPKDDQSYYIIITG